MYKAIKFSIIFFSFALLSGCASSCGSAVETNTNGSTNEVIVPKKATNVSVPSNSNGNTKVVPYSGAGNTNGKNPTLDNSKVKVIDTTDTSKIKAPPAKKMPDNSEVSSRSVGKNFVETRKFIDNKEIDKLERITGGKEVKVKVYLKNGKVIDVEEGKIKKYRTDSSAQILEAIGIKQPATKVENPAKTKEEEMKKASNK